MNKKTLFIFILSDVVVRLFNYYQSKTFLYARDPKTGDVSLFRVSIKGNALFTEAKYDAGWRNAEAVDEIFKDIKAEVGDQNKKLYDKVYEAQYKQVDRICTDIGNLSNLNEFNDKFVELNKMMSFRRKLKYSQIYDNPNCPSENFSLSFLGPNQDL